MNHTVQLPYLPISLSVLAESRFFVNSDARIVRAGFWLLEAAWRSSQPGSIASSFEVLAGITRLSAEVLHDNFELLLDGWELQDDGRYHYPALEAIVRSVQERFGPQLEVIADAAVVACQGSGVQFELLPPTEVKKKQLGKQRLPKDFSPDRVSTERAIAEGYDTPDLRQWLQEQFFDYAEAQGIRALNWQATFRNYMGSDITRKKFCAKFGYPLGQRPAPMLAAVPGARLPLAQRLHNASVMRSQPSSFSQQSLNHNRAVMASAAASAQARRSSEVPS